MQNFFNEQELNDLNEMSEQQQNLSNDLKNLKLSLEPLIVELREAELKKDDAEKAFNDAKEKVNEIENYIRKIWGPFIRGVDNANIEINGCRLESKTMITPKPQSEAYISWLQNNGYGDVMKWQVHPQTFKSIAIKLYNSGVQIPDVEYIRFNKIKLR